MPSFGEVDTAGKVYRHDDQQISQPALPRCPVGAGARTHEV